MGKVIVVEFVTADGVIEDPDGSGATKGGGWAFHAGPEVFAGDKFGVAASMESGVLLLGRTTWEMFSTRWPTRSGGFADLMNATPKVVVSRTLEDVSAWENSSVAKRDLDDLVLELVESGDVIVIGSMSVVRGLAAAGLIDEYRLIVIPIVVGTGARMFPDANRTELDLAAATTSGATVLLQYEVRR